jgi:hypothetical protein
MQRQNGAIRQPHASRKLRTRCKSPSVSLCLCGESCTACPISIGWAVARHARPRRFTTEAQRHGDPCINSRPSVPAQPWRSCPPPHRKLAHPPALQWQGKRVHRRKIERGPYVAQERAVVSIERHEIHERRAGDVGGREQRGPPKRPPRPNIGCRRVSRRRRRVRRMRDAVCHRRVRTDSGAVSGKSPLPPLPPPPPPVPETGKRRW